LTTITTVLQDGRTRKIPGRVSSWAEGWGCDVFAAASGAVCSTISTAEDTEDRSLAAASCRDWASADIWLAA
jgi:hypothetical protein